MKIPHYLNLTSVFVVPILTITLITSLFVMYLVAVEQPYLTYPDLPFKAMKKTVYPGEILPMTVTRCNSSKTREVFTSTRFLDNTGDDQEVLVMDLVGFSAEPGCKTTITTAHRIPEATAPGRYQVTGVASVPGLTRNFLVDWWSEPFLVLPLPKGLKGETGAAGLTSENGKLGKRGLPSLPAKAPGAHN